MTEKQVHTSTLQAIRDGDEQARQKLLQQYLPLIIKTASGLTGRYLRVGQDEEISIGLMAVNEAIDKYNPERGASFTSFASLVIKNRLKDYLRTQRNLEIPASAVAEDLPPLDARQAWTDFLDRQHQENRRVEVTHYVQALARYNLDLKQLAAATPRHKQARQRACQAARILAGDPQLARIVRTKGELPLKQLEGLLPVSRKTLERQRKYILALFILISGNYQYLNEYLPGGAEEL